MKRSVRSLSINVCPKCGTLVHASGELGPAYVGRDKERRLAVDEIREFATCPVCATRLRRVRSDEALAWDFAPTADDG